MDTVGEQLKNLKQASFIGREKELRAFDLALSTQHSPWQILNIHGPGGIGKSTLLDAFRRMAEKKGICYCYLDAQYFAHSKELFLDLLASTLNNKDYVNGADKENIIALIQQTAKQKQLVIAIDTFEDAGDLSRWLHEQFLPQLPSLCTVVIAGRSSLTELWKAQPIWQKLITSLPLENFDRTLTDQYLKLNGIDGNPLIERAWLNTDGYPLALSLSVALAQREGKDAIITAPNNSNIITELTQRWLREIPDKKLRSLIDAAATIRCFNQDLLSHIADEVIDDQLFQQLVKSSFIRHDIKGWSIHSLVKNVLNQELSQRSPERHARLTLRALNTLAQMATSPSQDRGAALNEFFYLLGDSLVRAAFYSEEIEPRPDLFIENANHDSIDALEEYMRDWRHKRGVLATTKVELIDHVTNQNISEEINSEPREPEFIDMRVLLDCFPGAIRLLKDHNNYIHGLSIVLPINEASFDYLASQPVTGSYFSSLTETEMAELKTPPETTHNWFVRLIDTRDPANHSARAVIFRNLTAMLIQPARFVSTTPLMLYQKLLKGFGFERTTQEPHYDFGKDRPAPYFVLDLRGKKMVQHLEKMIRQYMGEETNLPLDSLLASVTGTPAEQTQHTEPDSLLTALTAREKDVAHIAAEGVPNCTIAARLDISEITVKKHMSNIFTKLGVRNRAELIRKFWGN